MRTFRDAVEWWRRKKAMPTAMTSAELAELDAEVREAALFSSRTMIEDYLREIGRTVDEILSPREVRREDRVTAENPEGRVMEGMNDAEARVALKRKLQELSYKPEPGEAGTIKDLSSDKRINLVVRMNKEMAQGYGQWRMRQEPDVLRAFPCSELYRQEARKEPRNWVVRWQGAGGKLYGGRMIARKDDPVWEEISAFGVPYPPFDYNSGMWVRDVARSEAVRLGVIEAGEEVEPQRRPFEVGSGSA